MPYKSWESLNVTENCVREWASDLSPKTARNYVYYLLHYIRWAAEHGYWNSASEMLDDYRSLGPDEKYKHIEILERYIKSCKTGSSDRRARWYAVKSFYEYHRLKLPELPRSRMSALFRPSDTDKRRAVELKPLELEEVRKIVLNAPQPYKAAIITMFQGAMGLAEFEQFNRISWKEVVKKLDEPGPVRVDLYREKTSREKVRKYYTFIGEDAKTLIKEWLTIRPKAKIEYLFITFHKQRSKYVPVTGRQLADTIRKIAKRIGLIGDNSLGRYHIHAHEFRDLFKSLCTLSGVNPVASEFFLGHKIDKLGYDKSPEYDVEWFKREYMKVEPKLNVISNPSGADVKSKMEEMRKEIALEAIRRFAEALGIDPMKVRIEKRRELGREPTLEEEIQAIQYQIKKIRQGNNDPKKIITEDELEDYLSKGWDIQLVLPSGKIVIRKPI